MRCGKNTTGVRTPPFDPPAAMRRNEGARFKTDSLVLIGRLPLFLHDRHIVDEETPLAGLRLVRLTPVSYTHLDVYKRQTQTGSPNTSGLYKSGSPHG